MWRLLHFTDNINSVFHTKVFSNSTAHGPNLDWLTIDFWIFEDIIRVVFDWIKMSADDEEYESDNPAEYVDNNRQRLSIYPRPVIHVIFNVI